jgi:hypothetical protein
MAEIATPALLPVADLVVRVGEPIEVGRIGGNLRRVIPVAEGVVTGPRLRGKVLAGGADFQLMRADGVTELEARYVIRLDDGGHLIYVENRGVRYGPPELMEKLRRGEVVDPALIYFRTTPRFETAAPGCEWLMRNLFVCSGARYPDRVEMRFFQVG